LKYRKSGGGWSIFVDMFEMQLRLDAAGIRVLPGAYGMT
jgi:hypothetical protein